MKQGLDPNSVFNEPQVFHTHEQELAYLRERLSNVESAMITHEENPEVLAQKKEKAAAALVSAYHDVPGVQVLNHENIIPEQEVKSISLNLEPEDHDNQMEELYALMISRGIKNTLMVLEKTGNIHLIDDFHRFLVQYVMATNELPNVKKTNQNELFASVNVTLFEITLPRDDGDSQKSFKEIISLMEQLYAGLESIAVGTDRYRPHYTLEVALPAGSNQIIFYAAIPNEKVSLFEKQVLGLYGNARIEIAPDDYNVFAENAIGVGAYATLEKEAILPLRTYDSFDHDPLDVLLNVFSNLDHETEGASVQFVIYPRDEKTHEKYGKKLDEMRKGKRVDELFKKKGIIHYVDATIGFFGTSPTKEEKQKKEDDAIKMLDKELIENVTKKLSSSFTQVNIRCIAAAQTEDRAMQVLHDVTSAFNQFHGSHNGNRIIFETISGGSKRGHPFFKDYIFRAFNEDDALTLNLRELATLYHFPAQIEGAQQLKQSEFITAPAPLNVSKEGIILGYNNHRGKKTEIRVKPKDRMRHFYIVGQTGTGKSGMMLNMVRQDIENGEGLCYIDPHGSDVQTIMGWIPPERVDDVVYFDPAYIDRPMGLNMLEYDISRPESKTLVIDEIMGIFNQLFDMKAQGGAMFQQYFKNSAFLVMDHPESGSTLLEVTRVLGDKAFRDMKMSHCKNPIVKQFWLNAEKTTGDQSLANFVPYISSKFDPLVSNDIMRPIIAQQDSAFNIKDIMDNKKILLVNLSKGRMGEINASLLGLILVGKIQMAALGRAANFGDDFPPFYLYIDEFQNVTTPSISSILSEARKYKLSLNMAHQYMNQLDPDIKSAVLGNVGSMQIMRISPDDAGELESRLSPTFTADDIIKLPNFNAYMSLLIDGQPTLPFNMETHRWPPVNEEIVPKIKELSYLKFGRPRAEVEAEIMEKYNKMAK